MMLPGYGSPPMMRPPESRTTVPGRKIWPVLESVVRPGDEAGTVELAEVARQQIAVGNIDESSRRADVSRGSFRG